MPWSLSLDDGSEARLTLVYDLVVSGSLVGAEGVGRLFGEGSYLGGTLIVHELAGDDDLPTEVNAFASVSLPFTSVDEGEELFVNPRFPLPPRAGANTLRLGFTYTGNPLSGSGYLDFSVETTEPRSYAASARLA